MKTEENRKLQTDERAELEAWRYWAMLRANDPASGIAFVKAKRLMQINLKAEEER